MQLLKFYCLCAYYCFSGVFLRFGSPFGPLTLFSCSTWNCCLPWTEIADETFTTWIVSWIWERKKIELSTENIVRMKNSFSSKEISLLACHRYSRGFCVLCTLLFSSFFVPISALRLLYLCLAFSLAFVPCYLHKKYPKSIWITVVWFIAFPQIKKKLRLIVPIHFVLELNILV